LPKGQSGFHGRRVFHDQAFEGNIHINDKPYLITIMREPIAGKGRELRKMEGEMTKGEKSTPYDSDLKLKVDQRRSQMPLSAENKRTTK
jgi:hypothetical protein